MDAKAKAKVSVMIYQKDAKIFTGPGVELGLPNLNLMRLLNMTVVPTTLVPPGMVVMMGPRNAMQWTQEGGVEIMPEAASKQLRTALHSADLLRPPELELESNPEPGK